jgi:hypothetical protein
VLLSALSLLVGVDDYLDRRALYQARRDADAEQDHSDSIQTYSQSRVSFHRPPEFFSVIANGLGERFGSAVTVFGRYGPPRLMSRSRANFLLPESRTIDFTFVLVVAASLLAMLLTSDALAGERQSGTLQLILAHSLPRRKILVGEYLGAMVSLMVPVIVSLSLAGVLLVVRGVCEPNAALAGRLLMFICLMAAVISIFVLLGLCCSAGARDPATALVVGLLLWILLSTVYPNVVVWLMQEQTRTGRSTNLEAESLLTREVGGRDPNDTSEEARQTLETFRNRNLERAEQINTLSRLAPFSCALLAGQVIAGTDLGEYRQFLAEALRLDQALADWQASRIRRSPKRELAYDVRLDQRLDLSDLPQAVSRQVSLGDIAHALAPSAAILLLWNLACAIGLQVSFSRYDVRAA